MAPGHGRGVGLLFQPANPKRGGRPGAAPRFLNLHTVHSALSDALAACKLPAMTLYMATRHTYAAHAVLGGLPLSALRELLGHHSTAVTERYGRLRSDMLRPSILPTLSVDLSRAGGEVISMAAHRGAVDHGVTMDPVDAVAADGLSTHSI